MLKQLMQLANGRVACALEGGYNIRATAECAAACVQVEALIDIFYTALKLSLLWVSVRACSPVQRSVKHSVAPCTCCQQQQWKSNSSDAAVHAPQVVLHDAANDAGTVLKRTH